MIFVLLLAVSACGAWVGYSGGLPSVIDFERDYEDPDDRSRKAIIEEAVMGATIAVLAFVALVVLLAG